LESVPLARTAACALQGGRCRQSPADAPSAARVLKPRRAGLSSKLPVLVTSGATMAATRVRANILGDIRAEADEKMLETAFLETADYKTLIDTTDRPIVIGRRGTGKSALAHQLLHYWKHARRIYSPRSVCAGSTREAQRAGRYRATNPVADMTAHTAATVAASSRPTPNNAVRAT